MKNILLGCLILVFSTQALIDTPTFPDQGQYAMALFIMGLGAIYLGITQYFEVRSPAILKVLKTGLIILVLGFALYSLLINNMPLHARRGQMFRIHDFSLWMMCSAILSALMPTISNMLSSDKLKKLTKYSGEAFFIFLILSLYSGIYMAANNI